MAGALTGDFQTIIRMNLKTGRPVQTNKTSGRKPQFYFLFERKRQIFEEFKSGAILQKEEKKKEKFLVFFALTLFRRSF